MITIRRLSVCILLSTLAACGGGASTTNASAKPAAGQPSPAAATGDKEAQELFQSLCSTCHGTTGHGDGPGAAAINPKPRSFSDEVWQASVTDEQIHKTITFGGAAVGKSPFMPAQPQLKGNTSVLNGLTKIIRGYRTK
jgi:mono/diheme cytochrome c family protein